MLQIRKTFILKLELRTNPTADEMILIDIFL